MRYIAATTIVLLLLISLCVGGVYATSPGNSSVRLYMPMNTTDGLTTFKDLSVNNYTFANSTKASYSTTTKKLGNASVYLEGGDSATLYATGSPITAAPYSVTMWFNTSSVSGSHTLVNLGNSGSNPGFQIQTSGTTISVNNAFAGGTGPSGGTIAANTWYYIAVIANGTHTNLYINGTLISQYTGTTMSGTPTRIYFGSTALNQHSYTGYIDDVLFQNITIDGTVVPSNEFLYTPSGGTPLSASFTPSSNPSTPGAVVTFTNTSTGAPTTFNWTIGGSVTNTTENAAYLFAAVGTYAVDLNVTNATGHFSNYTMNQVVANVSGFTQQDIWMEGQYLQTFNIVDSNNLPIANVTIASTSGNSYATANGTGYLTEPFGAATVTFVSDGYTSRAIAYVFDSDDTHSVTLYTSTPAPISNVNTIYSPQTVHLTIVDAYGVPQPGAYISVAYIASSLPSTDVDWLKANYGVNESVAADMRNSSIFQQDYTESTGGFVFTAIPVIRYNITAVNATSGMNHRVELTPKDSHYTIYCPLTGQAKTNNTLAARQNATLPWYSLNSTHLMLGMTYQDTTACTSSLLFRVWFKTNGTEIHNATYTGFGSVLILDNHTIPKAPIGTEYLWQYNATRVC